MARSSLFVQLPGSFPFEDRELRIGSSQVRRQSATIQPERPWLILLPEKHPVAQLSADEISHEPRTRTRRAFRLIDDHVIRLREPQVLGPVECRLLETADASAAGQQRPVEADVDHLVVFVLLPQPFLDRVAGINNSQPMEKAIWRTAGRIYRA